MLTFCDGFSGLGWYFQYLIEEGLLEKENVEELLLQLDELSYNSALNFIKQNNHDFLHGAVGNAIYLLNRLKDNTYVKAYLLEIIKQLDGLKQEDETGIYWTENKLLSEEQNTTNNINLSLSHGLASKIILLSKCYNQNINNKDVEKLLKGSINFMLKCKNSKKSISIFPSLIGNNNQSDFSRLSWCYGDLGISIALWQGGVALQDETIKQEAIDMCLYTTKRRTPKETGVVDAGICHGTAGIAHIYNRMYRNTKRVEFKEAANYWIEETIKMATFKDGLAGFKSYQREEFGGWRNDYGFLEGISGIGLVLESHLHPEIEPTWDRCLLLS